MPFTKKTKYIFVFFLSITNDFFLSLNEIINKHHTYYHMHTLGFELENRHSHAAQIVKTTNRGTLI